MIDPLRIGEGLSRPGIDPRTWTTLAIVTAVNVTAEGIYCDVTTITGIEETVTLPTAYGGPSYGFYCPVAVDDWVLIGVPEGDWNAGARILAQVWDQGTPPPAVALEHPLDPALVVEPGRTLRILTSEGGSTVIAASVKLGREDAAHRALLTDAYLAALGQLVGAIASAVGTIPGGAGASASITAALTAFQNAAETYKSLLVKLG